MSRLSDISVLNFHVTILLLQWTPPHTSIQALRSNLICCPGDPAGHYWVPKYNIPLDNVLRCVWSYFTKIVSAYRCSESGVLSAKKLSTPYFGWALGNSKLCFSAVRRCHDPRSSLHSVSISKSSVFTWKMWAYNYPKLILESAHLRSWQKLWPQTEQREFTLEMKAKMFTSVKTKEWSTCNSLNMKFKRVDSNVKIGW